MDTNLANHSLSTIFVVSVIVMLTASETGRRLGVRALRRGGDNVATLEAAILGLLALMISFTFAMALSRFEARRDAVLNEANAIGTTALRARLLPPPESQTITRMLKDYADLRLDISSHSKTPVELNQAIGRSAAMHQALWQQAQAVAAKDNAMVPTGLFLQTLNEMIDDEQKHRTAIRNQVPNIVLLALYGIAIIAVAFTGYAGGLESRQSRLPVYVMGMLVCAVILLIQDLDRPTSGFIHVSQQPMIDAVAGIVIGEQPAQ